MEAMDISDVKSHELTNLNLPAPPDQEELGQCLPCGSQILSSFDQSLCLPYIRKDHDLIDVLSVCVIKDASNHPRYVCSLLKGIGNCSSAARSVVCSKGQLISKLVVSLIRTSLLRQQF